LNVAIVVNSLFTATNFRSELIRTLVDRGAHVTVVGPIRHEDSKDLQYLELLGASDCEIFKRKIYDNCQLCLYGFSYILGVSLLCGMYFFLTLKEKSFISYWVKNFFNFLH
jgi:hypothetical protein